MTHDSLDSFFGTIRDEARLHLTDDERTRLRRSTLACVAVQAAPETSGLHAFEKGLLFGALTDLTKSYPLPSVTEETEHSSFQVWHGNLFNRLQPFVLR